MGLVVSLFLIAACAIMRFAVTVEGNGFNVGTVGMILMIVGGIGAVLLDRLLGELGRVPPTGQPLPEPARPSCAKP